MKRLLLLIIAGVVTYGSGFLLYKATGFELFLFWAGMSYHAVIVYMPEDAEKKRKLNYAWYRLRKNFYRRVMNTAGDVVDWATDNYVGTMREGLRRRVKS